MSWRRWMELSRSQNSETPRVRVCRMAGGAYTADVITLQPGHYNLFLYRILGVFDASRLPDAGGLFTYDEEG